MNIFKNTFIRYFYGNQNLQNQWKKRVMTNTPTLDGVNARLAQINIPVDLTKWSMTTIVKMTLQKTHPENYAELVDVFTAQYDALLKDHETEDTSELLRYYRLVMQFKPALATILKPGADFDNMCDYALLSFNVVLDRIRSQLKEDKVPKGKVTMELKYFCAVCHQAFDIPPKDKAKIENSDDKLELPKHCGKEMIIKIMRSVAGSPATPTGSSTQIYPAEVLMGHMDTKNQNAEYLKILSVGIDVGSSTSHLIFSRLTLKRETSFFNMTNRFNLVEREIIYESDIIFTPLLDKTTIDIEKIVAFCHAEYDRAKITPEMVDTGAVIVTGETAKKENAAEIVRRLSSESGKFVSASAGPNFESMLGIMGSGIVDQSRVLQQTLMNVDVGGGTSNIGIASKGEVISTSCINVGGRLLGIDQDFKIWRIDEPTEWILTDLGMNYHLGDTIPLEDVLKISKEYAKALLEVMQGPATCKIAKSLIMTEDIEIQDAVEGYSFSGGGAEMIYEDNGNTTPTIPKSNPYNDIGCYLAEDIKQLVQDQKLPLIEPENKIRATVIGAGAFSLSVSGSTCYYDKSITLPLVNIPVVPVSVDFKEYFAGEDLVKLKKKLATALKNFNLVEGEDMFALYIKDTIFRTAIVPFAKSIERAFPKSIAQNKMILIILGADGGKMLGKTLKKETAIQSNLFCLDEIALEAGDWVDIGAPLQTEHQNAFPVTIKSLVFNQNKKTDESPAKQKAKLNPKTDSQLQKSTPKTPPTPPALNIDKISRAFQNLQQDNMGYERLIVLSHEGTMEFTTDPDLCSPDEAVGLYQAWKGHRPAVMMGDHRFPILSWGELQFAAGKRDGNGYLVGSKTKTNRYAVVKINPGKERTPNIAALAATIVNRWAWNLF